MITPFNVLKAIDTFILTIFQASYAPGAPEALLPMSAIPSRENHYVAIMFYFVKRDFIAQ